MIFLDIEIIKKYITSVTFKERFAAKKKAMNLVILSEIYLRIDKKILFQPSGKIETSILAGQNVEKAVRRSAF